MPHSTANPPEQDAAPAEHLLRRATDLVRDELTSVDRAITARLTSEIELIQALGAHITAAGGKRLRPLIVLLSANACKRAPADHRVTLAAVIEFIHTATLLHDDVVDASSLRRGRATANQVWGNEASVLVGDFLYSRAFEMILETENLSVMRILAATTNAIAEGEVMQLSNRGAADLTEAQYMETIRRKTAKLFESAAQIGAEIGSDDGDARPTAFAAYGLALGIAFQLVDDVFDYVGDRADIGKNIGDDLAEGKLTLPLIRALQTGDAAQRKVIKHAIKTCDRAQVHNLRAIVETTGALAYTQHQAQTYANAAVAALADLPPSAYQDALAGLAEYAVRRKR